MCVRVSEWREGERKEKGKREVKSGLCIYRTVATSSHLSSSAQAVALEGGGRTTSSSDQTAVVELTSLSVTTSYCWKAHSGSLLPVHCNTHTHNYHNTLIYLVNEQNGIIISDVLLASMKICRKKNLTRQTKRPLHTYSKYIHCKGAQNCIH